MAVILVIELALYTVTDFRALTGCGVDVNMMFACHDVPLKMLREVVFSLPNFVMLAPVVFYAQAFSIGLAISPGAFALLMAANVVLLFAAIHIGHRIWCLLSVRARSSP